MNVTGTITKARGGPGAGVAQLLWTLVGSGQGGSQVKSLALIVNGKPFVPAGAGANPVQNQSQAELRAGDRRPRRPGGLLPRQRRGRVQRPRRRRRAGKQTLVAKIGAGYTQIAVSQDGKYLAALRDEELYIGPINGPLARQQGSGYMTLSWDPTDNLWTTTGAASRSSCSGPARAPNSRAGKADRGHRAAPAPSSAELFTALQIAPDGVRVAMILNSDELTFGAIVWAPGTGPGLGSVRIQLSPFNVSDLTSGFTR